MPTICQALHCILKIQRLRSTVSPPKEVIVWWEAQVSKYVMTQPDIQGAVEREASNAGIFSEDTEVAEYQGGLPRGGAL